MAFKCDNGVTVRGFRFVDCSAARAEAQHSSVCTILNDAIAGFLFINNGHTTLLSVNE